VLTAQAQPIIECINDLTRTTDEELQFGISRAEASQLRTLLCRLLSNIKSRLDEFPPTKPARARRYR